MKIDHHLPQYLEAERVLNAHQAAELMGVSIATFRRLYWTGRTPAAIRLSDRRLGWRVRDLLAHIGSNDKVA